MQNLAPLHWVRKIDEALFALDRIPLYGNAPRFDLEKISSSISSCFGVSGLALELGECSWQEAFHLTEGLGSNLLTLGATLTPLSGELFWVMDKKDIASLTSWLLNGKAQGPSVGSEILQEGFYRYLALNALDALQSQEPLKEISLKLDEEAPLPQEACWCADIKLSFEEKSCWGRLIISSHLMTSWQRHFASLREIFSLSPLAKSIEVPIGVKTGSILLRAQEWKNLKKGDFVLLDKGSYDAKQKTGAATLMLGSTPLFHVAIKENKIKLLDYALFYEEDMETKEPSPELENESVPELPQENAIPPEEGKSMAVKDFPLFVTVELARLRMSVDQLMKLSPGNFLDLPIDPQQGVVLTVNGQKVGRAEIVYLGEQLGIRILETA